MTLHEINKVSTFPFFVVHLVTMRFSRGSRRALFIFLFAFVSLALMMIIYFILLISPRFNCPFLRQSITRRNHFLNRIPSSLDMIIEFTDYSIAGDCVGSPSLFQMRNELIKIPHNRFANDPFTLE